MRREVPLAYRALLLLFPRRFRREFGKQMEDLFARMLHDRAPTRALRARLWTKAITDIVVHAGVERMRQLGGVLSRSPEPRRPRRRRAAIAQDIRYTKTASAIRTAAERMGTRTLHSRRPPASGADTA